MRMDSHSADGPGAGDSPAAQRACICEGRLRVGVIYLERRGGKRGACWLARRTWLEVGAHQIFVNVHVAREGSKIRLEGVHLHDGVRVADAPGFNAAAGFIPVLAAAFVKTSCTWLVPEMPRGRQHNDARVSNLEHLAHYAPSQNKIYEKLALAPTKLTWMHQSEVLEI